MPLHGTYVQDSLAPTLLDAVDLTAATDGDGAATRVSWPGDVTFELTIAAVTGTDPTLDVTIEASNDSTFATGVVQIAAFPQLTDASANSTKHLTSYVEYDYVRAVTLVGGTSTPTFNDATLKVRTKHDHRTSSTTAGE